MKKLLMAALLPLLALSCQPGNVTEPLPVMSFNVRYGTAKDGDHVWDNRKDAACAADDPGRIPNNPAIDLNQLQQRAY